MPPFPEPHPTPDFEPVHWRKEGVVLVLSDPHIPFHRQDAIDAVLDEVDRRTKKKIDLVLLLGDLIDSAEISDYAKTPRTPKFADECGAARDWLAALRKRYRKSDFWYKLGNHEHRLERKLNSHLPALATSELADWRHLLGLKALKVRLVAQDAGIRLGFPGERGIWAFHGHEFGQRSSPVNPAKSLYEKTLENAFCGHHHVASEFSRKRVSGELVRCFTVASLCETSPEYRRFNQYGLGAALVTLSKTRPFRFDNLRYERGVVL